MGLFKSKDERLAEFFSSRYREVLARDYRLQAEQGYGGPYALRSAHLRALRQALFDTQNKFHVRFNADQFDRSYLEMSCAEYGFSLRDVLSAKDPML